MNDLPLWTDEDAARWLKWLLNGNDRDWEDLADFPKAAQAAIRSAEKIIDPELPADADRREKLDKTRSLLLRQ